MNLKHLVEKKNKPGKDKSFRFVVSGKPLFIEQGLICCDYIKDNLTYKIIGCAMKVHSIIGNGFQEVIYQRFLAIEMNNHRLSFRREMEMQNNYEGHYVGTGRVDFSVEDRIILELKAVIQLEEDVYIAQAMNYCEVYNLTIGS